MSNVCSDTKKLSKCIRVFLQSKSSKVNKKCSVQDSGTYFHNCQNIPGKVKNVKLFYQFTKVVLAHYCDSSDQNKNVDASFPILKNACNGNMPRQRITKFYFQIDEMATYLNGDSHLLKEFESSDDSNVNSTKGKILALTSYSSR